MPRAFDPSNPQATGDPNLSKLDFNIGDLAYGAAEAALEFLRQLVEAVIDEIKDLTGVDLSFLGDIFEGIDLTAPGAILSAITGAVQALVSGIIQRIIDTIFGGLTSNAAEGNPVEVLTGLFQQLQNAVTNAVNSSANAFSIVSQFGGLLHQFMDDLPDAPTYVDPEDFLEQIGTVSGALVGTAVGAATDIALTWVQWLNALTGQSNTTATATATSDQLAALTATTAANSATIAALQSDQDATNNNGMSGRDDFERTSTTDLGTGWDIAYSAAGPVLTIPNGHDASLVLSGSSTVTAKARRIDPVDQATLSDYQKITWTIGSYVGTYPFFGGVFAASSGYGRMNTVTVSGNAPGTVFVRGYADPDKVGLFYANGGAETQLGSYVPNNYSAGGTFALVCGTVGGLNFYQILYNNRIILPYTDTGLVTSIGSGFRGWGFGLRCGAGSPQVAPPNITGVTVSDNFPATVTGTQFRVFRASTSNQTTTTNAVIPAAMWDTVHYASLDSQTAWASGSYTVPKMGAYMFNLRLNVPGGVASSVITRTSLRVNGVEVIYGQDAESATTGANAVFSLNDTWILNLSAGDVVTPAITPGSSGPSVNGDSAGRLTYFAGVKVG